jgi:hypothetical protein
VGLPARTPQRPLSLIRIRVCLQAYRNSPEDQSRLQALRLLTAALPSTSQPATMP